MLNKMESRIAIITGASKGIGKSIKDLFKKNNIICYDFSRSNNIDITNETQVQTAIEDIIKTHSKIDILVNNAGVVSTTNILDMDLKEWNHIINND